jgi:PiT family inorganic phosphate transporter
MGVFIAILVLLMAFSNCVRDSSTIVATVVSARVLSPKKVFLVCSFFEFAGVLLFGSAVAATVGQKIFDVSSSRPADVTAILVSALIASMIWGLISWRQAWPTSNNQSLFGALLGAGLVLEGGRHVQFSTMTRILIVLISSPILGFAASTILTRVVRAMGEWMTPGVRVVFDRLHALSCFFVSFAHGSNDGQIIVGLVLLVLGLAHSSPDVPLKLRIAIATVMGLGVLMGGRRILQRGMSFCRVRPPQGLCADMTAAGLILTCASMGLPASTVQVVTGSIVGAGAARNPRAVKWQAAKNVVISWFITIPASAMLAAGLSLALRPLFRGGM